MDGPKNNGIVHVYMTRRAGDSEFEYTYLYVEVPGHDRIYIENNEHGGTVKGKAMKLFGIRWN